LFFTSFTFVVGGTEEEAERKAREFDETASARGYAAHIGGGMGVDLAEIDLDTPVGELEQYRSRGGLKSLIDSAPDRTWTFRDVLKLRGANRVVGTPEQIADKLQELADAGVDGINVTYYTTPGSFVDFIEGVTPVLQARGLQQSEYPPGPCGRSCPTARQGRCSTSATRARRFGASGSPGRRHVSLNISHLLSPCDSRSRSRSPLPRAASTMTLSAPICAASRTWGGSRVSGCRSR
jgi:hypothetical protein